LASAQHPQAKHYSTKILVGDFTGTTQDGLLDGPSERTASASVHG